MVRDQTWKDIRSSVTPAFTTGKIKRVIKKAHFPITVNNCFVNKTDVGFD